MELLIVIVLLEKVKSDISSDFPFNFINGVLARFDILLEAFLYNSSPIIQNFHLNFKIIPAGSAYRVGKTAKKSSTYVKNPPFPTILADCRRCPPFQNPILRSCAHHPGLAGIGKNRNCRMRSRISRKSLLGTATSAI